jgi:4-amino-4-deoxy-L-arabinose transferase-like glycosyltransferase
MGTLLTLDYIEAGQRREIVMGGVLLGLALFTRPDGSVVASVALLASLLLGRAANLPIRLADVALAAAACALVVMPWEIFRLAYYHAALPNTYYAKIVGIPLDWRQAEGIQYWDLYIRCAPNLCC